jgi:Outer membrane protein beta-barrel domain
MQRVRRGGGIIPFVVLLASAAVTVSGALARDTDGSWEVGAYVLNSKFDNSSLMADAQGAGVRAAYHFKAAKELEADFDKVSGDHISDKSITFDTTKYSLDYLANFLPKGNEKMTPFITFGAGRISVDNGTDSITRNLLRAGGGMKYFFTPHLGVRLDVKGYRWRGDPPVTPKPSFFSLDATLGMTFLFGGAK